jgi:hypothetical protein
MIGSISLRTWECRRISPRSTSRTSRFQLAWRSTTSEFTSLRTPLVLAVIRATIRQRLTSISEYSVINLTAVKAERSVKGTLRHTQIQIWRRGWTTTTRNGRRINSCSNANPYCPGFRAVSRFPCLKGDRSKSIHSYNTIMSANDIIYSYGISLFH